MFETKADIEQELLKILTENRPGTEVRGCSTPLEVYAHRIQSQIIEPLWRARADAGLIREIEDKGHQLTFTACWNRAVNGASDDWDCRYLANTFLWGALRGVPDLMEKQIAEDYDAIDDAILRNLPEILFGDASLRWSTDALSSWVTGERVRLEMDGFMPHFLDGEDRPLKAPRPYAGEMYLVQVPEKETAFFALMSFHGSGIDYDEGQRAWEIWREATDQIGVNRRGLYDSLYGRMLRTMMTASKLNMTLLDMLQDEAVSYELRPEGVVLYRGCVEGLEHISDEGRIIAGPRSAFLDMLVAGGFEPAAASDYLTRLAASRSALEAQIPEGSSFLSAIDPEMLLRTDAGDDVDTAMCAVQSREEAYPIVAAGCFGRDLPRMPTWREVQQRRSRELERTSSDLSPAG